MHSSIGLDGADRPERPCPVLVILHVDNLAVPEAQDLEQLLALGRLRLTPSETDDDPGPGGGDDLRPGFEDAGRVDAACSVEEDRPGLVRTVSARGAPPP